MQGNYSDLLVSLSNIYSKLRGDSSGEKNEDAAQVGGEGGGREAGKGSSPERGRGREICGNRVRIGKFLVVCEALPATGQPMLAAVRHFNDVLIAHVRDYLPALRPFIV